MPPRGEELPTEAAVNNGRRGNRQRLLRRKNGPVTLKDEYASIIRTRNLTRLCFGLSSAWKTEVCDTRISRAACARVFPARLRRRFASMTKSRSVRARLFDMAEILIKCM